MELTKGEVFEIYIGASVFPRKCGAVIAAKIQDILADSTDNFESIQKMKAEWIADNYKQVKIPYTEEELAELNKTKEGDSEESTEKKDKKAVTQKNHVYKVEVNDQFKKFLHPLYAPPQKQAVTNPFGEIVWEDESEGIPKYKEFTEEQKKERDDYVNHRKIMEVIENDDKYTKYIEEITSVKKKYNFVKITHNDLIGVNLPDRRILQYLKPLIKKR